MNLRAQKKLRTPVTNNDSQIQRFKIIQINFDSIIRWFVSFIIDSSLFFHYEKKFRTVLYQSKNMFSSAALTIIWSKLHPILMIFAVGKPQISAVPYNDLISFFIKGLTFSHYEVTHRRRLTSIASAHKIYVSY